MICTCRTYRWVPHLRGPHPLPGAPGLDFETRESTNLSGPGASLPFAVPSQNLFPSRM